MHTCKNAKTAFFVLNYVKCKVIFLKEDLKMNISNEGLVLMGSAIGAGLAVIAGISSRA